MSKITKKKQIEDLQTVVAAQWRQINKLKLHLGRLVDIDWHEEQAKHDEVIAILDGKEPKLKQLDQSVFDGLDEKWRFAAVDKSGKVWVYSGKPDRDCDYWFVKELVGMSIGGKFDTSNWKNSLTERDKVELTGGDLCRAMLARGDTRIMCKVYDEDRGNDITHVIRAYSDGKFHTKANRWAYAVPINNQGEPLTQSDVGL